MKLEDLVLTLLENLSEQSARLVRIETRLSKLLIHLGLKADGSGPLPKDTNQ